MYTTISVSADVDLIDIVDEVGPKKILSCLHENEIVEYLRGVGLKMTFVGEETTRRILDDLEKVGWDQYELRKLRDMLECGVKQ